ncbi:Suppressor of glycerol defect protein 1 [Fusarium odoratissimum]|uniref:Suppressor of glycerol defect protein 1 n=1 Tax=Fusarium oxysporum f. sp. cubense (strain race 4) TaxID=2502994 RepID=N1RQ03_FUSC4|nr:Suppressor of glycerol defect protein 1 [Fusarium odoratissimum]
MTSAPELQQKLFKRMGLDVPEPKPQRNGPRRSGQQLSRKEQRKAQRVQKRTHVYARATPQRPQHINNAQRRPNTTQRKEQANKPQSRPPKQISDDEDDLEDEDEYDAGEISLDEDDDLDDLMDDEEDDDEDEDEEKNTEAKSGKKGVSKAVEERLAQDDAEIEAFERKLGIKKGRKSLPQSFKQDGLGDLLGDLSGEEDVSDNHNDNKKRKSEYDDWLASKRRKTVEPAGRQKVRDMSEDEEGDDDMGLDDESGDEDEDMDLMDEDDEDGGDFDNESFGGLDDDEGDAADNTPAQPRQRENPYVAPTTGVTVAKYVPPSLRRAANSEEERKSRLRKQVQGLINRLTDANILSIVKSVEELYQNNARGDVTDVMTDAIMAQICKPESLPDQFFVLTGGFAAAIYRLIGSSFGSVLIRRIVEDFGGHYEQASKEQNAESAIQKEASNILTLLSQLYVFEVVTCKIIFDYMERLLSDLNEINVELLLRICRMAGRMLKQDDQQSLKHVSGVLNQSVSKVGYSNISARTKFMVETITDLTKGKKKARGLDFTVVSEHVQRMKKRLDKSKKGHVSDAEMSDHEDMDIVLPDYPKKARAQDRLWKIFRSLGESMFGEAPEEDESADAERMKDERRITNVAKFYAALVADGTLNIAILKPLELPEANHWTSMFVQLFILALLKECRSKKKGPEEDIKLEKIFGAARDLPGLAAGIHWMLRKKVRKTKLVSAKELKKLEGVGEKAQIIVRPAAIEV